MRGSLLSILLLPCLAARAQSANDLGVARLNQDVQALWTQDGVPLAHAAALAQARKMVGVPHALNSKLTATIVGINSLTLDLGTAPGLRRLDANGFELALPRSGAWSATLGVEVRARGKLLFVPLDQTFAVTLKLSGLTADLSASFDSSHPEAPRVQSVHPPVVRFHLEVRSTNVLVNGMGFLASGLVDGVGQALVLAAGNYFAGKLGGLAANLPSVMNAGGPGLAPIARADLESAARKLGDELERYRTPFGPLLEMRFDAPYDGTWGASLADPAFDPGAAVGPSSYGDSGEFTGHYLASLAYQYASTHDAVAQGRARRALATLRTLITMRDEPGSMNRSIMPLWYLHADQRPPIAYTPGSDYAAAWNGDLYYFTDYASRDEYLGLFHGLSIARDLFDDPAMKASAQASMELALDYLLRHHWTWRRRDGSFGEHWAGTMDQQYAWILATWYGNPGKYQSVRDDYKGLSDILWTGMWMAAADPYGEYYKFQLGDDAMQVLLTHETDPAAWMRSYQAIAIMRHYIGHHLNAHFNNTYLAFDPASKPRLAAENVNLLSRWLGSPRRRQRVDLHGDPSIEKVWYTPPLDAGALAGQPPKPIQIAKYPLPPDQRIGSGNMWTVSPCQLDPGYAAGPDAYIEGETLDFLLPYWMSRYYGAIAPPGSPVGGPPQLASAR